MSGVTLRGDEILSGAARAKLAGPERIQRERWAKVLPRFYLKSGDEYLHWSGSKLTPHKRDAYIGFAHQVAAIRRSISLAAKCRPVEAN